MKKTLVSFVALVSFAGLALAARSGEHHREDNPPAPRILAFDTMYGVDGPFVGAASPIREVIGDELPWVIGSAKGALGKATVV